jgi:replicative superfamily II helicase
MEMTMVRMLSEKGSENAKVIYVAPTKALCHERAMDWKSKFGKLNISCNELTGDSAWSGLDEVKKSTIIVTTPEKWDSITRTWRDYKALMKTIRLFLIDEVHMLASLNLIS